MFYAYKTNRRLIVFCKNIFKEEEYPLWQVQVAVELKTLIYVLCTKHSSGVHNAGTYYYTVCVYNTFVR